MGARRSPPPCPWGPLTRREAAFHDRRGFLGATMKTPSDHESSRPRPGQYAQFACAGGGHQELYAIAEPHSVTDLPSAPPGHLTATSAAAAAAQRHEATLPSRAANAGEAQMISHDATPGPRAGVDADDCVPGKGRRRPKGRRASEP